MYALPYRDYGSKDAGKAAHAASIQCVPDASAIQTHPASPLSDSSNEKLT